MNIEALSRIFDLADPGNLPVSRKDTSNNTAGLRKLLDLPRSGDFLVFFSPADPLTPTESVPLPSSESTPELCERPLHLEIERALEDLRETGGKVMLVSDQLGVDTGHLASIVFEPIDHDDTYFEQIIQEIKTLNSANILEEEQSPWMIP
jgi:hypothetical protein